MSKLEIARAALRAAEEKTGLVAVPESSDVLYDAYSVPALFSPIFPKGIRHGESFALSGSVVGALVIGSILSSHGVWIAVVNAPTILPAAFVEFGWDRERTFIIPELTHKHERVMSALVENFGAVYCHRIDLAPRHQRVCVGKAEAHKCVLFGDIAGARQSLECRSYARPLVEGGRVGRMSYELTQPVLHRSVVFTRSDQGWAEAYSGADRAAGLSPLRAI